jgi:hypothetical protein
MGSEIKVLGYEIKGWVLGFQIKYLRFQTRFYWFQIRVLSLNFENNVDCTIIMFLHQLLTTIPK